MFTILTLDTHILSLLLTTIMNYHTNSHNGTRKSQEFLFSITPRILQAKNTTFRTPQTKTLTNLKKIRKVLGSVLCLEIHNDMILVRDHLTNRTLKTVQLFGWGSFVVGKSVDSMSPDFAWAPSCYPYESLLM